MLPDSQGTASGALELSVVETNPLYLGIFFFYMNKSGLQGPCVQCSLDENTLGSSSGTAIFSGALVSSSVKWGCAIVVRFLMNSRFELGCLS